MPQNYVLLPAHGSTPSDEWVRLGIEAHLQSKLPQAQQYYQKALALDPTDAKAVQNLALVFAQSNLMAEAILTIERASLLDDQNGTIYSNWALMALELDRIDEALAMARKGLALNPNKESRLALAVIAATAGLPSEAIPLYEAILDEIPTHEPAGPNLCFIQTLTMATAKDLRKARQRWYDAHAFKGMRAPHTNARTTDRPLRVGYVSGDFKCHSAAMIFSAVVLKHTDRIVPYFYSTLPVNPESDATTKEFQTVAGDRWRDIQALTDEQADALIRQDQIDVLVDLAGHTNGGRLALFTRKPAPVQVTAWGFAHGTGLPEMDAFFADPVAVPVGEREHYSERIIDLPCIVTYRPQPDPALSATSPLPWTRNGYITFGCFARYEKLNDECLRTYAEILRRVPESVLVFKDHAFRRPYSIRRVRALMPDVAHRLRFAIATPHVEHLRSYQTVDLILDPFPHSGGVVGLEQLWMGVPMVAMNGPQAGGRTTASILTAMKRTAWIVSDPQGYVEQAVAMAQDTDTLKAVRLTLRQELESSPVMTGYVDAVEAAYRALWSTHCS